MNRVLLIEDDMPKQRQLLDVVRRVLGEGVDIDFARSMNPAIDFLDTHIYDCVLLDMSLPTFNEGGGYAANNRQHDLAGRQILTYMMEMEIESSVFLITQLPDFLDEDGKTVALAELHAQLAKDFPGLYFGHTHFHHSTDKWSLDLEHFLKGFAR
jgi:CheY-like chemotaxis protein